MSLDFKPFNNNFTDLTNSINEAVNNSKPVKTISELYYQQIVARCNNKINYDVLKEIIEQIQKDEKLIQRHKNNKYHNEGFIQKNNPLIKNIDQLFYILELADDPKNFVDKILKGQDNKFKHDYTFTFNEKQYLFRNDEEYDLFKEIFQNNFGLYIEQLNKRYVENNELLNRFLLMPLLNETLILEAKNMTEKKNNKILKFVDLLNDDQKMYIKLMNYFE